MALPPTARLPVRTTLQALDTDGQVSLHVLSLAVVAASVGTGDGELVTLDVVALQSVGCEGAPTVFAVHKALATVVDHVGLESVPGHLQSTFVFTIQRFKATDGLMFLHGVTRIGLFTVDAVDLSLVACKLEMILHTDTGNLGSTFVHTKHSILLTHVEVALEPTQGSSPHTTLFTVDAEHGLLENLGLGRGVTAQLQRTVGAGLGVKCVGVNVEDHFLACCQLGLTTVGNFFIIWRTLKPITIVQICHGRVFISMLLFNRKKLKGFGGNHVDCEL